MEVCNITSRWDIMFQYIKFDVKHLVYWYKLQIAPMGAPELQAVWAVRRGKSRRFLYLNTY